jgi:hypothetical protein
VILAAVIAAFVFGMGSNVQKTKSVACTAQIIGTDCVVTYQGGQDNAAFGTGASAGTIVVMGDGAARGTMVAFAPGFDAPPAVGDAVVQAKVGVTPMHVTATATFLDGTSQVILDAQV